MLINFISSGLEVISHPAHGLLSGKIANEIKSVFRTGHWVETLTAIIEHDDAQLSPKQKNCVSKRGMPLDFLNNELPPEKSFEHVKKVFERVLVKSSWSAMLLSRHLEYLYSGTAKELIEFEQFLTEMKTFRKSMYKLHNSSADELEQRYQLMVFSDRLSLILCQNEIPEMGRELEINKSVDDQRYFVRELDDEMFTIRPWIFESDSFELCVDSRLLKEIKFKNEAEFTKALTEAEIQLKRWKFSKATVNNE